MIALTHRLGEAANSRLHIQQAVGIGHQVAQARREIRFGRIGRHAGPASTRASSSGKPWACTMRAMARSLSKPAQRSPQRRPVTEHSTPRRDVAGSIKAEAADTRALYRLLRQCCGTPHTKKGGHTARPRFRSVMGEIRTP